MFRALERFRDRVRAILRISHEPTDEASEDGATRRPRPLAGQFANVALDAVELAQCEN